MGGKESVLCNLPVDAYGRELVVLKEGDSWQVFDIGNEGKRRRAKDIRITDTIGPDEIVQYLSDLLHETASARHPEVFGHR